MKLIIHSIKKNIYNLTFLLFFLIFSTYFYSSFNLVLGDNWAYNELFINYSSGVIRRGLLGTIFLFFHENYGISPLKFFSTIFLILYTFQIFIYYLILKKYKENNLFLLVIFCPALILFNIYDINTYYVKDVFINLAILFHCLYIIKIQNQFNEKRYNKFLLICILPVLIINILNHETQVFFLGTHILLTLYVYNKNNKPLNRIVYSYAITLLPLLIIILNPGNFDRLDVINKSIETFGAEANQQLAGNINLAIGGFLKWHFFFQEIGGFVNFLFCFILSIFLFYTSFSILIANKILKLNSKINKIYLLFFIPCLALFILALDYGRVLNLILTHMLAFYLILEINYSKLKLLIKKIVNNLLLRNFIIIFLLFYFFMWYLPQGGGYSGIGQFNGNSSILANTLIHELTKIFMIIYNFIDYNFINLPRIIL